MLNIHKNSEPKAWHYQKCHTALASLHFFKSQSDQTRPSCTSPWSSLMLCSLNLFGREHVRYPNHSGPHILYTKQAMMHWDFWQLNIWTGVNFSAIWALLFCQTTLTSFCSPSVSMGHSHAWPCYPFISFPFWNALGRVLTSADWGNIPPRAAVVEILWHRHIASLFGSCQNHLIPPDCPRFFFFFASNTSASRTKS